MSETANSRNYGDFRIPPDVQLERDKKSLELLLHEKAFGSPPIEGKALVNVSKNPRKELWKAGTLDQEIARRKLIMEALQTSIPSTPTPSIPTSTPQVKKLVTPRGEGDKIAEFVNNLPNEFQEALDTLTELLSAVPNPQKKQEKK